MKWAMSQDYVAIVTTVIIAEVAVSSLLMHQFLKPFMRVRPAGTPDSPGRTRRRGTGFYVATSFVLVWIGLVGKLTDVEVDLLAWSGTEHPEGTGADPELAEEAFRWASASLWVLVGQGLVQAVMEGVRAALSHAGNEGPSGSGDGDPTSQAHGDPTSQAQGVDGRTPSR
ncbi:hypothetical protein [Streptomyces sp. NPDC059008]|uniref:hypothetical protein n=1 Tax=Streptomyces sp. NPDC059008 TaxID=3346693 RepID=UPI0036CDD3A3